MKPTPASGAIVARMVGRVMERTNVFKSCDDCKAWLHRYFDKYGLYPHIARPYDQYTSCDGMPIYENWNDKEIEQ